MAGRRIIGLGRVIHDAHWDHTIEGPRYLGSRGGGSNWNILANAAGRGAKTAGIGVVGDDSRGALALEDNQSLGIDVSMVDTMTEKTSSTMHHFPKYSGNVKVGHQTTSKCPRCNNRVAGPALNHSDRISAGPASYHLECSILVADQLTSQTAAWAREVREVGWITTLDIGYPGYLRFSSAATLLAQMQAFDLVVIQAAVANFLTGKLGGEVAELARGFGSVLIVSDGPRGLAAWDGRGGRVRTFSVPAPVCEVVDTVGAGDALMGGILAELAMASLDGEGFRKVTTLDLEDWCLRSMEFLPAVLASPGARSHLGGQLSQLSGVGEPLTGAPCGVCGGSTTRAPILQSERRVSASLAVQNISRRKRVLEALAQPSDAVDVCAEILADPVNTVVVGTGGSFPAAVSLARLLTHAWGKQESKGRAVATAMRPMDVLLAGGAFDRVIGISYSGGTPDVRQALTMAATRGSDTCLVTGGIPPMRLNSVAPKLKVVGYGMAKKGTERSRERGFVGFVGAAAPLILWLGALYSFDQIREVIRSSELTSLARQGAGILEPFCGPGSEGGLAVIGSGWAEPAMLDIESKFVEGGLANAILHDSKDFSHGRFQSLSLQPALSRAALYLRSGVHTHYEALLLEVLRKELGPDRVYELTASTEGPLGMLQLLLASQDFSVRFGEQAQIDISRPKQVGRSWLDLYRWDSPLLSGLGVSTDAPQQDGPDTLFDL